MTVHYKAYDVQGRLVTGTVDGVSELEAVAKLQKDGLFPFEAKKSSVAAVSQSWLTREVGGAGLKLQERGRFARVLSALIGAGVPLDRALVLMSDRSHGRRISRVAGNAAEAVVAGQSLSNVLGKPETGFARHEVGLIASAEHTGAFAPVLENIANMLDRQVELRGKLGAALVYPAVLLFMALVSLVLIVTVLIPNLAPLFEQGRAEPPIFIGLLMTLASFVSQNGVQVAVAVVAMALICFLILRSRFGLRLREGFALKFLTIRQLEGARLSRTLATLLKSGVSLQSAIRASASSVKFERIRSELQLVADRVVSGSKLSTALADSTVLDSQIRQLIAIGEETNRVEDLLLHAAQSQEAMAMRRIERLMTLLTPAMTLVLGVLVGGLIMSVMRAILSVNELAL